MKMNIIPRNLSQSDKIGKFTLPELGVVAVGVFLIMVNIMMFNLYFGLFMTIPIAILTFLTIKMKINELPVYKYLFVWLIFQTQPKQLLYRTDNRRIIEKDESLIEFTKHKNLFEDEEEEEEEFISKSQRPRVKKQSKNINIRERKRNVHIDDDEDFFV